MDTYDFTGCLLLGEWILPGDQLGSGEWCEKFEAEWEQVYPDGSRIPVEIPGQCEVVQDHEATIETILPEDLEHNTFLRFWSQRQDMEIYVDGELRQEYTTRYTRLFGKTSSAALVFFELKPEDSGKQLTVSTSSDSAYAGVWRTVYIGDRLGIWMETFHKYGAEVVVAFLVLVLSVISILVSRVLRFYYHKKMDLEYLGWTVLLASVWLISNSVFRQVFFRNISVASDITFYCIMLMPIPFLIYMNSIQQRRYQRIYVIIGWIAAANLLGCTILQVGNWKDFTDTILYIEAVDVLTIVVAWITMILDLYRRKIREYLWIAVGILGACLAAMAQMFLYSVKINIPFHGITLAVGLVFLLVLAVFSTMKNILRMERERSEALLASESKARFLANMSHEIRTPINAVLGLDEIIIRESHEKNIRDYARDIQSAGRSLLSLINDILDFSKIESGKMEILPVEYEISSLVNDCYNMIRMRAEEKGLGLAIENSTSLPKRLMGDEVRIRQIVTNLLTNAVKYTKEGGIILSVNSRELAEDRILLDISVKDTGMGISKEDQEKLFQSFQRVDEKRNRNVEGTGLGLAITRQLVELMDGNISVESVYGEGSVFTVELPQTVVSRERAENLLANYRDSAEEKKHYETFRAPEGRILVVDDVNMNLKVIVGLLKNTQLQIDTARSGAKCLKKAAKKKYHMIFLDHMMPDMDGVETLEAIRESSENENRDTPVIMLTANAIVGAREEYLSAGFSDYLSKPVRGEKLEEMILKYLPEELVSKEWEEEDTKEVPEGTFLERLNFLNVAEGMLLSSNNEEFYREILETYLEDERYELLVEFFEKEDWNQYRIQVHGLKSITYSIGAGKVADQAKALEQAVREENISYVREHHEEFLEAYGGLLIKLKEALES